MDTNQMEGWLLKKKSKSSMFNNDVRRWFKIQSLEGTEDELALCYFSSNKSKDAKGWIFLTDIEEITEEKSTLTVISPARTMTVEAQNIGEHRMWISALVKLCPKAHYVGETASKYRSNDHSEEKSSSRDYDSYDSKNVDRRDMQNRRSQSRESSLDRDRDARDDRDRNQQGSRDGREPPFSRNRDDFSAGSDDERRGRGKHEQSHRKKSCDDNNSTGSNGSRGRASRMPNTTEDHRKGGNRNYPDASTAARMHSHISGEPDERSHRGRPPPPQQPSRATRSRSRDLDEEDIQRRGYQGEDSHRESYELEAYDLSKASSSLSREERLQFSKENEMRRQYDDGNDNEEKDSSDDHDTSHRPAIVKRKKPAPPPANSAQPRWKSPPRGGSDEEKSQDGNVEESLPIDKPVEKRGVSIEDMIDGEPVLTVNLDEDSDDEEKVDFKAEKRRYANDAKAQSSREKLETAAKSKPPLAPPKTVPPRLNGDVSSSHKSGPSSSRSVAGSEVDPNFLNDDDWDDDDANSPPKAKEKPSVQTGSQADNNWLDEDFDD